MGAFRVRGEKIVGKGEMRCLAGLCHLLNFMQLASNSCWEDGGIKSQAEAGMKHRVESRLNWRFVLILSSYCRLTYDFPQSSQSPRSSTLW